jgi:hypothetical protein
MEFEGMTENSILCPKCKSPVTPGMKFCESCGTKIETVGIPLVLPAQENSGSTTTLPAAGPPAEPVKTEPAIIEKQAPEPARETKVPKPQKPEMLPKAAGPKKPLPQQTIIIAGVLVLVLLAAAIYFIVLPALSGPSPSAGSLPSLPVLPGTAAPSATQAANAQTVSTTLTAGPTQVPPGKFALVLDAERDPISHVVTVTFKGGAGQYGVSNILVQLTRSDGQVLTQNFKPASIGSGVTLQGTEKTDRVEATATYYSGEHYKILDHIFEYQKRNG